MCVLLFEKARCSRLVLDRWGMCPGSSNPSLKHVTKYGASGGEKPNAVVYASSDKMRDRFNRTKKTAAS